jgi:hypothetical protein
MEKCGIFISIPKPLHLHALFLLNFLLFHERIHMLLKSTNFNLLMDPLRLEEQPLVGTMFLFQLLAPSFFLTIFLVPLVSFLISSINNPIGQPVQPWPSMQL